VRRDHEGGALPRQLGSPRRRTHGPSRPLRRGLTIVELSVTLLLASVALYALARAVASTSSLYRVGSSTMDVETRGRRTMDLMVDALQATDLDSIAALPASPFSASQIDFQVRMPFDGVLSDLSEPLRIVLDGDEVFFVRSPGLADERPSAWCSGVTALAQGEELNGLDDNGNGLIDETGLAFSRNGSAIEIYLTLEDTAGASGATRSWSTGVTCRN